MERIKFIRFNSQKFYILLTVCISVNVTAVKQNNHFLLKN
jgi:hypothetical protein